MKYVKVVLSRLKNPMVIISISSQILIILLTLFRVSVNTDLVNKVALAAGSILVSLGIFNNPAPETVSIKKLECCHCGKMANHVMVNGKFVCEECGCAFEGQCPTVKVKRFIK